MQDFLNHWFAKTKELSLYERNNKITDAIRAKHAPPTGDPRAIGSGPDFWVIELYEGYGIVQQGSDYFKVGYAFGENGLEVAEAMVPVEKVWREKVQ
jgi:hypothetical protein